MQVFIIKYQFKAKYMLIRIDLLQPLYLALFMSVKYFTFSVGIRCLFDMITFLCSTQGFDM